MSSEEIKKKILEKIKEGEVAMKPRWHFILKAILHLTGVVIVALGLLYILSFIVFALRESGVMFIPLFGMKGVFTFLYSSPWLLVLLAIVFVVALEVLVRKYAFVYKRPMLYILFAIVVTSLFGTYAVAKTHLHSTVRDFVEERNIRPVGAMYDTYGKPKMRDVHVGMVVSVEENILTLENRRGEPMRVITDISTRMPKGVPHEGDVIVVFGERTGDEIHALGVGPMPKDVEMRRPMDGEQVPKPRVEGKWRRVK